MSCYKCGKDLPAGEVECPEGCGEKSQLMLVLEMKLNAQKVASDRTEFDAARQRFANLMGEILVTSGLVEYIANES